MSKVSVQLKMLQCSHFCSLSDNCLNVFENTVATCVCVREGLSHARVIPSRVISWVTIFPKGKMGYPHLLARTATPPAQGRSVTGTLPLPPPLPMQGCCWSPEPCPPPQGCWPVAGTLPDLCMLESFLPPPQPYLPLAQGWHLYSLPFPPHRILLFCKSGHLS